MATNSAAQKVIVFGGSGFVGRNVVAQLSRAGHEVVSLSSRDIDLTDDHSVDSIADIIDESAHVIFLSALTPDRSNDIDSFWKNLRMAQSFVDSSRRRMPAHVCYIGSDGVYPFSDQAINENSETRPTDWYSAAHLARESLFKSAFGDQMCVLRPTMVFGPSDPHHSYGPNRFLRDALSKGVVALNGKGEETRDHIYITDVAELICKCSLSGFRGVLNLATGEERTFLNVAERIQTLLLKNDLVRLGKRTRPITHRKFDVTTLERTFPDFKMTKFDDALIQFLQEEQKAIHG